MQDLSDNKHEKKGGETNQTCERMRRSSSVLSDLQRSHLLSRERNTTRRTVPITADSKFDDLTESVSMGHCVQNLNSQSRDDEGLSNSSQIPGPTDKSNKFESTSVAPQRDVRFGFTSAQKLRDWHPDGWSTQRQVGSPRKLTG